MSDTMEDPTKVEYPKDHPLRVKDGEFKGRMPHEAGDDFYVEWCILNGMTDKGYWVSVGMGEAFLQLVKEGGKPLRTEQLTADQRGWAKERHPHHFHNPVARWQIDPGHASVPVPFIAPIYYHDRRNYATKCECAKPDYEAWGTRWDGVALRQCQKCGEVVEGEA